MPRQAEVLFEPRKSPVQARSAASVGAILEATVQVLLDVGKERLTTTRVAQRAGVSVGTLYQYFPNKSALLQAALRDHMESVAAAIESVCQEQKAKPMTQLATILVDAFLEAKMKDLKTSTALYSVSSDVDGLKVVQQTSARINKAIVAVLANSREMLRKDPLLIATLMQGAMAGVSRRLLESPSPEKHLQPLKEELGFMMSAYLEASLSRKPNGRLPTAKTDRR